jgi:hypothetical protein
MPGIMSWQLQHGVCECSSVPTLMSAKGMRMPDSSMQMLCALRCSTREMAALRVSASFLKAVFSKICTQGAHEINKFLACYQ